MKPPICQRSIRSLVTIALLGAASSSPLLAQAETKGKPKGKPGVAKAAAGVVAEEEEDSGLQAARFMPLNKPNLRVKIPQFKDGELECVMKADEMTRVNDKDIDIRKMEMQFLEGGEVTTRIQLRDARYSLEDRLLSSDNQAVIQRTDFTLVGDSLEFDTVEQRGKMIGKVRMVIHDASGFRKEEKDGGENRAGDDGKPDAESGLSIAEAARLIARVAAYQREQPETPRSE